MQAIGVRTSRLPQAWREIIATSSVRLFSVLAQLGVLVLTARWLGPAGRGAYVAAWSWATLLATFASLSLGQVALQRAAEDRAAGGVRELLGSLGLLAAVLSVVALLGGVAADAFSGGDVFRDIDGAALVVAAVGVPFLVLEQYTSALLLSVERLRVYNRLQVVSRLVSVLATAIGVLLLGGGVAAALAAAVLGQVVAACGGLPTLVRVAGGLPRIRGATVRALLAGGVRLHLNAVGAYLFTSSALLLLQHFHGSVPTGLYSLAWQLVAALLLVAQAASLVLYGKVAARGPDDAWRETRRVVVWLTAASAGAAVIGAAAAPLVVRMVGGSEYAPAVGVLQILLFTVIGQTFAVVMAPQWIGRGLFWQASLLTLATGALNVVLNLLVIPRYSMYGAAWVSVVTYVFAMIFNVVFALRIDRRLRRGGTLSPQPATVLGAAP